MLRVQQTNSTYFISWIPAGLSSQISSSPGKDRHSTSLTLLSNNTSVRFIFKTLHKRFRKLLNRRAFVEHYTIEGMDELEFIEAENNLNSLIADYHQWEDSEGCGKDQIEEEE